MCIRLLNCQYNGRFFKFGVEVGVELSIVNALYRLRITDQLFKSYTFRYTSGALSIDSPTPTSTPNLKKHPLLCFGMKFFYSEKQ
jgi:hypothetical protein